MRFDVVHDDAADAGERSHAEGGDYDGAAQRSSSAQRALLVKRPATLCKHEILLFEFDSTMAVEACVCVLPPAKRSDLRTLTVSGHKR